MKYFLDPTVIIHQEQKYPKLFTFSHCKRPHVIYLVQIAIVQHVFSVWSLVSSYDYRGFSFFLLLRCLVVMVCWLALFGASSSAIHCWLRGTSSSSTDPAPYAFVISLVSTSLHPTAHTSPKVHKWHCPIEPWTSSRRVVFVLEKTLVFVTLWK